MRKQFNSALQNEAIDRSNKNKLKINKNKIVSQVKLNNVIQSIGQID